MDLFQKCLKLKGDLQHEPMHSRPMSPCIQENVHDGPPICQSPGRFLGIIGRDSSVSKSNRLHVDIFWVFFIKLESIP